MQQLFYPAHLFLYYKQLWLMLTVIIQYKRPLPIITTTTISIIGGIQILSKGKIFKQLTFSYANHVFGVHPQLY
jgi:hypothetical protein